MSARRSLSFEERVKYQRAVEEVYWRHTNWPKASDRAKPSLESIAPLATTRAKVEDTLRKSEALAELWKHPVTGEALQAEVARMARESEQPEVLRELHQSLDNDPFLIAEVLARPILVERLARNFYAQDDRFHGAVRARAEDGVQAHSTAEEMRQMGGDFSETIAVRVEEKAAPRVLSAEDTAATDASDAESLFKDRQEETLKLSPAEWDAEVARLKAIFNESDDEQMSAHASSPKLLKNRVSGLQEDADSFYVTAVTEKADTRLKVARVQWQKTSFDAWWAGARDTYEVKAAPTENFNYQTVEINQAATTGADDTWTPTKALPAATNALWPSTAIWTGSEMIIWGGQTSLGGRTNSGARYNPATDTWTPTSTINAPRPRRAHSAVWTGSEMIIWGGCSPLTDFCGLGDGGRYNPATDTWTPVSTTNSPGSQSTHTAVWTGSKMITWGGCSHGYNNRCTSLSKGGVYDPATDTWTPVSSVGAPSARSSHRAVWTGSEMIIWGSSNTGGRYNPQTNTWTPTETFNAPSARGGFTMVWTGSEVVVWGGYEGNFVTLNTGGRYNPATNSWTPTSTANAPAPRYTHSAVWTGTEMIVWGGDLRSVNNNQEGTNTGGRYNPATDSWTPTSTLNAPTKLDHNSVWTGTEMIVWSGSNNKEGGRYNPQTDSWVWTDNNDSVPSVEAAVWTGSEMIVWGPATGCGNCTSASGRYNPATRTWRGISTADAPAAVSGATLIWTGSEMIVWGADGGRYNPQTDSWTRIQTTGAPFGGGEAVWTGSELIVWSGVEPGTGARVNTGARYNPTTDTWTPISTANAPSTRDYFTMVWTGSEAIVWGGVEPYTGVQLNTGGRYNPSTDTWTPTSTASAPSARNSHTAVWTGSEMIVWAGMTSDANYITTRLNTGGRYNPQTDSWQPTSMVGAPTPRTDHTAIWTGSQMIVWGGNSNTGIYNPGVYTGARYSPQADAWTPTSTQSAPSARTKHVAVWTGTGMIIWGGIVEDGMATHGAIYFASSAAGGNTPPSISISNPAGGSTFESGDNITINTDAMDGDGSISSVHFYANNTLIGADTAAPFNFNWNEVRGGSYSLTAVATDNSGGVATSSPVLINVNVSTAPPVCVLASPVNGATYTAPADVVISADARANRDRTMAKVEFFKDNNPAGTYTNGPYGYTYTNLGAGTYNFSVRCTDSAGAVTTSPTSVVTINASPTTYRVTGQVTNSGGSAIPNLRVRLDGPQSTAPVYATTNLNGYFQFYSLESGGSYTVTPESSVYTFSPPSVGFNAVNQNYDNVYFVATQAGYGISGRVTDASGNPLYPATLNLSGSATRTTSTDATGYYFFSNLAPGGTYTIQPYKNQYTFEPATRTYTNLSAEQTADFVATNSTAPPSSTRTNVALASNGATVTASSMLDGGRAPGAVINGDRKGLHWGTDPATGSGWHDATSATHPDWIQINFATAKTINEVDVFTIQDNYTSPVEPTDATTFTAYGITAFDVQYWNGASWATVPNGSVTGNNKVKRAFTFSAITTDKIRLVINNALANYSRVIEVEAYEGSASTQPARSNVALASSGAVASASSQLDAGRGAAATINGDRLGLHWGTDPATGSGWHDATASSYPDWLQVNFNGSKTIDEVDIFTIQDAFQNPAEPTEAMTFGAYGVTGFEVQYWTGATWATVPNGLVIGNNNVWRKVTFAPVTTDRIRVLVNNSMADYSRLTEVEAYGVEAVAAPKVNVALASNGAAASASSEMDQGRAAAGVINGDRRGLNWGNGGGWHDATGTAFPDWVQVDFNGAKTIDEINVFTIQDNFQNPVEPTDATTFTAYGTTAFDVQYWDGAAWVTVPQGSVTGNNKVKRAFTFSPVTTTKIRVLVTNALAGYSRLTEVEAYQTAGSSSASPATNVALASNGAVASASSELDAGRGAAAAINGDRLGIHWGSDAATGSGWHDATSTAHPDWLQVSFSGSKTITEVRVFTIQDNFQNPVEPTEATTFSLYGITAFDVQYWDGTSWVTVPGGSVTGNDKVRRAVTFPAITTDKIRVLVTNALAGYSRIAEVEAY